MIKFITILALCCLTAASATAEVSVKEEVPFRADSGLTKAEYFLTTGKYAEALNEAAAVIKRHGANADAYAYLGYAYGQLGDARRATESYARALAIMPTHLGANAYMALSYLDQDNLPKALEQMQVLRAVCGTAGCEELLLVESAVNAARKGQRPGASKPAAVTPARGATPREVE